MGTCTPRRVRASEQPAWSTAAGDDACRARRGGGCLADGGAGATAGTEESLPTAARAGEPADGLQIAVAPTIAAHPASQAALPIRIAPADALPKNSFVRVRGLPPTVSLSEGYATAPGAWSVPIHALASLQMIVPAGVTGRAELSISLVTEDGALLAQARPVLVVQPPPQPPLSRRRRPGPSRRSCRLLPRLPRRARPSCRRRTARRPSG